MRASSATALAALLLLSPALAAASPTQRINGTRKADRIDAVYGGADRISCGRGVDVVTADPTDTIARDCEFVSRRISSDTLLTAPGSQHQTEVEPSVAAWGSTAVAAFQVGRFVDGGASGIGWATSRDSGRTWRSGILPGVTTASSPPGEAGRASDPAVAYDAAHATWLVSTLVLGDDFTALGISRSADGLTWSTPVSAARFSSNSLAYDKEWVACDNTTTSRFYGSCYLAYTEYPTPRLTLQVSHDGGATWGAPVPITTQFGVDAEGVLPVVQSSGALTMVYLAGEAGIYASRSTDGGATFAAPVGISPVAEARQRLLRAPPLPTAAVDSTGRMYVAWTDCAFRTGCDGNTVVLSTSNDGVTWSAAARVPGTGFDSFVPGIAADPSALGRISIVTYVRTSGSCGASTCTIGVAVTRSRDGGATWTKPQRLDSTPPRMSWLASAGGQFVGDYVGATYAGGRFVPVFALASKPLASGRLREYMLAASLP